MKATFNFLTKRTQQCPFEMSSRSPTSPGAFSPSEPCQKQLNIRKLFEGLFHISRNPIISRSLTTSSHVPSRAVTMLSVALGRLEVTSRCPALGTARLVGSTRRGTCRGPCLRLFAQAQVCIVSLVAVSWGEVRCYAVSGQRARALWSTLSSQRIRLSIPILFFPKTSSSHCNSTNTFTYCLLVQKMSAIVATEL